MALCSSCQADVGKGGIKQAGGVICSACYAKASLEAADDEAPTTRKAPTALRVGGSGAKSSSLNRAVRGGKSSALNPAVKGRPGAARSSALNPAVKGPPAARSSALNEAVKVAGKAKSSALNTAVKGPGHAPTRYRKRTADVEAEPEAPADPNDLSRLRGPCGATKMLMGLNVLGFIAAFVLIGPDALLPTAEQLLKAGADYGPYARLDNEFWRVFSSIFTHAGIFQLAIDLWLLFVAGRIAEKVFGHNRLITLYVVAGVVGEVATLWWNPGRVSVGASAAICGIIGALASFFLMHRDRFKMEILQKYGFQIGAFVLYNIVLGIFMENLSNAAHAAGLLTGIVLGFCLSKTATPPIPLHVVLPVLFIAGAAGGFYALEEHVQGAPPVIAERKMNSYDAYVGKFEPMMKAQDELYALTFKKNADMAIVTPGAEAPINVEVKQKLVADLTAGIAAEKDVHPDDAEVADLHALMVQRSETMLAYLEVIDQKGNFKAWLDKQTASKKAGDEYKSKSEAFLKKYHLWIPRRHVAEPAGKPANATP